MSVALSFIVPALGNSQELNKCLRSLFSQNTGVDYEVLVVFCKHDMEVESAIKDFGTVKAIRSDEYMFPGVARNLGARYALADIFGFIDSDCTLDPNWISSALETIEKGAVTCSGTILDAFPWNLIASSDNRLQYADLSRGRSYGPAAYLPGAHLVIKRNVFETMKGFDHSRRAQDVLLTMAIARRWPAEMIFNPGMIAYHSGRGTWRKMLQHHNEFGYSRAHHEIQVNRTMKWITQHPGLGWVLFLRRFSYITLRVIQWDFWDLPRYLFQMPFILTGLIAWVKGFYKGMMEKK